MTPTSTPAPPGAVTQAQARQGGGRNRVIAAASIEAVAGAGGVTRLPVLASQVPLVLRRTPDAVYLVGGAAGPIGGDVLALRHHRGGWCLPAGADRGGVDRAARA